MGGPTPRTRRSSEEVQELVLASARDLFLARGYDGTTTADIARHAGVPEKQLFRTFGTKAGLFDATVLQGFAAFARRYRETWTAGRENTTPEQRIELLVKELVHLAEENRAILMSAVNRGSADQDDPQTRLVHHWAQTLQSWEDLATEVRDAEDLEIDPPASIAALGAMAFGMVMLEDLLIVPGPDAPSRDRRVEAMIRLAAHGLLARRSSAS
ncbi:MAG: TetR/AcrR family transcriptional regulator [Solirubrobacterales bacterium]|nr:TetR/AcrR family transcriptional regulator [Solirubrobacterales bacterium]